MDNKKIDVILNTMTEEDISIAIHFLLNHEWFLKEFNNLKPEIKMDLYNLLVQYQITTIYNYSTVSYMSWVVRFFIVLF